MKQNNTFLVFGTLFFVFFFYVVFPTNNSSLDAFAYAGNVNNSLNLFKSHHLLYDPLIYSIKYFLLFFNLEVNTLSLGKLLNSLFQIVNLYVFFKILSLLGKSDKQKILYILVVAFCFNLWRFGTENETYIMPITFSLLGSFYFLKYLKNQKLTFVFVSSFFAALACLFHQLHFFWWLGILIGICCQSKKIKTFIYYVLPAFIVPVVYMLVLVFYEKQELTIYNYQYYLLQEFYKGTVMTNFGLKGVLIHIINSFRTFIQLHPNMIFLLKYNVFYVLSLFVSLFLMAFLIRKLFISKVFIKKEKTMNLFFKTHAFILIANYLMAFYNYGNVEFMVMIPFLLVLIIIVKYNIEERFLTLLVSFLFIWNFSFGILPNNQYNYYNNQELVGFIKKDKNRFFIVKDRTVINQYFYETGESFPKNILLYEKLTKELLDSLLVVKKEVFTDVIHKPELLDKKKLTSLMKTNLFSDYNKEKVYNYEGFYGKSTIFKIKQK